MNSPRSAHRIADFVRAFNIDLSEVEPPPPGGWRTFNDFFTRRLRDGAVAGVGEEAHGGSGGGGGRGGGEEGAGAELGKGRGRRAGDEEVVLGGDEEGEGGAGRGRGDADEALRAGRDWSFLARPAYGAGDGAESGAGDAGGEGLGAVWRCAGCQGQREAAERRYCNC